MNNEENSDTLRMVAVVTDKSSSFKDTDLEVSCSVLQCVAVCDSVFFQF